MSHDGGQEAARASAGLLPSIPVMPSVPSEPIFTGRPYLLLERDLRHSLGWRHDRKAGPSFVVARLSRLGTVKVAERFPLTEQGWASAWRTLSGLDTSAAAAIAAQLVKQDAGRRVVERLTALDGDSLCSLGRVTFNGGSGEVPLFKGHAYDVRFLSDRIILCPPRSVGAILQVPYRDVETVEVSGPSPSKSTGELIALILTLSLLGALLGLLLFRLTGLFIGAVVFGLIGALLGATSTKIETSVRISTAEAELHFLDTQRRSDALRIELSEPLRAIGKARAANAGDSDDPPELAPGSVPDQLSKLASLLEQGLITRDEFEHLKAKLIAGP